MSEMLITAGTIAGGLGLFLLSINLITEGLKLAAGETITDIVRRWTHTPARGITSGITVTAIVQSSSAVTVAAIGFVNANLLSLQQSLGVIYGANVGTTFTGWLVAAIGFEIDIHTMALPLIGLGMALHLTGQRARRGAWGLALAGFGLFFVGIDILRSAFENLASQHQLQVLPSESWQDIFLFLWIGFFMTVLTQSSSASIAMVLAAASGGAVPLSLAAAMIIGANVGTTSTAAFAVIGATPNAKRVATAHILFNVFTAILALALLPLLLEAIKLLSLDDTSLIAITLALFHTLFNVMGVVIMWPITPWLARFLQARYRSHEEEESEPRYLDKSLVASPSLAYKAACMELEHIADIARRLAIDVISSEGSNNEKINTDILAVHNLVNEVDKFVGNIGRTTLPNDIANELPNILRASHYLLNATEQAGYIAQAQPKTQPMEDEELASATNQFHAELVSLLKATVLADPQFSLASCNDKLQSFDLRYHQLKDQMLSAGARQKVRIRAMSFNNEQHSRMRRMAEQMLKATRTMHHLNSLAGHSAETPVEAEKTESQIESATRMD